MTERPKHVYVIEPTSACNLRCPSCPAGSRPAEARPKGVLPADRFERIVRKIVAEGQAVDSLCLYNWSEPLLHPELPRLVEIANASGLPVCLSSNLNLDRNLEAVMAAGPAELRVSISGFRPATYGRTHRGGDIEVVKKNLQRVRTWLDRHRTGTNVIVLYHCYVDNLDQDIHEARAFSHAHGFQFWPVWAYLMPLETLLDVARGIRSETDIPHVDLFAIPPQKVLEATRHLRLTDCPLRASQTVINSDGSVSLCCAVYDRRYTIAPDFLEIPQADLQRAKYAHPLCSTCLPCGLPAFVHYDCMEAINRIAASRVGRRRMPPDLMPAAPSEGARGIAILRDHVARLWRRLGAR